MTTPTLPRPYQDMLDPELVWQLGIAQESMAQLRKRIQRLEHEVMMRLEKYQALELFHPEWECTLKKPSPTYDVPKLRAILGETVDPGIWKSAYIDEHPEVTIIPAKFNGTQMNSLARKHGKPITDAMAEALLPSAPGKLKVSRKEA